MRRPDARPSRYGRESNTGHPHGSRSDAKCPEGGRPDSEQGGATVILLAVGMAFVLVGTFGAAVAGAAMAAQRAAVAADLGALAGASRAFDGDSTACTFAADIAARNGGRLVDCRLDGLDLLVTVETTVTPLPGLTRVAASTARAGPVRG
ncbi:secretion/DNA translocation related TadE-like protein [Micromonospora luteifusca]|uniref:Secretion/DNA translocation related TadE-like protein n=1 Tax=Micromonospora luteifusca TaxID=709860 RepID=A0ABS2LWP9_9ACTN|nr:Rv3654c family TadE-like protein [Micromonospora luteifusca]MBM7492079.1 secretion/DNA translocation related TadE-like protein [Micromonospora luteifusca]